MELFLMEALFQDQTSPKLTLKIRPLKVPIFTGLIFLVLKLKKQTFQGVSGSTLFALMAPKALKIIAVFSRFVPLNTDGLWFGACVVPSFLPNRTLDNNW